MKKTAKLLGAAGVIAFSTGCLGAFTASADPFVATLPVTTIATQNGGYTFEVTQHYVRNAPSGFRLRGLPVPSV
jgi:hypothetical protein